MYSSISYAIVGWNEHREMDRLLHQMKSILKPNDEIVIQLETKSTDEIKEVIKSHGLTAHTFPLNDSFKVFKNNLNKLCTKDYIFQIDADEFLSDKLARHINTIIRINPNVDCFYIPRINTLVDESVLEDYKDKSAWKDDRSSWINYPDRQKRLFKNKDEIVWTGCRMHTHVMGFNTEKMLEEGYDLIHAKSFQKQNWQDKFYETF